MSLLHTEPSHNWHNKLIRGIWWTLDSLQIVTSSIFRFQCIVWCTCRLFV